MSYAMRRKADIKAFYSILILIISANTISFTPYLEFGNGGKQGDKTMTCCGIMLNSPLPDLPGNP
jgi:hypothetical protein